MVHFSKEVYREIYREAFIYLYNFYLSCLKFFENFNDKIRCLFAVWLCNMNWFITKYSVYLLAVLFVLEKVPFVLWETSFTAGQPSTGGGSTSDKGKEWQMELLMEKLRSKASTFKPLVETAKNMRMTMLVSDLYLLCYFEVYRDTNTTSWYTGQAIRDRQHREESIAEVFGHSATFYQGYFLPVHGRAFRKLSKAVRVSIYHLVTNVKFIYCLVTHISHIK